MMSHAIPGLVDNEITIMGQVGTTTAGEDGEPFASLQGFKGGTLVSVARTAAMISTWLTIAVEMSSSFRAALQGVHTRQLPRLEIPNHH
jgi:hypothetical protein